MTGSAESPASLSSEDLAKQTPMMRQYLAVKAEHASALVLFRLGDFFEAFGPDAVECARLLDLTLTSRAKDKDAIPMCGVPHTAVDSYVSRLIELGKTVVLVDQVEDAKLAKGLVKRAVTDILTPGTFLDPNAPGRVSSYLASLSFAPRGSASRPMDQVAAGLAVLDLSTGEFRATLAPGLEVLVDELLRLEAKEVLLPAGDERLERLRAELPKTSFTPLDADLISRSGEALRGVLGADEVQALERQLEPPALAAAGQALAYVAKNQVKNAPGTEGRSLAHVRELKPYLPGRALGLDQAARVHLELFRAADGGRKGSLIGAIDEARTAMGGRLVARWLAYPSVDPGEIQARQAAVAALVSAPSAVDRLRAELAQVPDLERLVGRVVLGRANPRDLVAVRRVLQSAPALLELAERTGLGRAGGGEGALLDGFEVSAAQQSERLLALARAELCRGVEARLAAALVDEPPVELDAADVFRPGYDAELDRLSTLAKNAKELILRMEAGERDKTGISSLKIRYNRVFGYYLEVTKANLKAVPARYERKQTTVGGERFTTEELKALEREVLTAEEHYEERTRRLFAELVAMLAEEARALLALGGALAELDLLTGFAFLAERRGWTRPVVDDSGLLEITDGRHPVLELLSGELGERFVPNDLSLSPERSLMIITGPNMAGKSTIMRQTALIAILAHMGVFVPAKSARVGILDRVFTRVGASDDLSRGRSTFMVEMTETARILRSATARSLVVLDEIGRGTSTFDGLSIAWAVAEHLHDVVQSKTLFATHYHELTELCRDRPRAENRHVAVKEWNEQIVFLRKLVPGPTNKSYGVQVARLAGLPRVVVDRAREVLAALEAQALAAGQGAPAAQLPPVARRDRGQLFLFQSPPPEPEPPSSEEQQILEELRALEVDDLTPRQALATVAAWRERLQGPARTGAPPRQKKR